MKCCRPVQVVSTPTSTKRTFSMDVRLRASSDFGRVFQQPVRFSGAGYTVLACLNSRESARLGLAMSKRWARRAVQRNRLKRIARESFRFARPDLPPVDIVVQCTRDATKLPNHRLRQTLDRAWFRMRSMRWGV